MKKIQILICRSVIFIAAFFVLMVPPGCAPADEPQVPDCLGIWKAVNHQTPWSLRDIVLYVNEASWEIDYYEGFGGTELQMYSAKGIYQDTLGQNRTNAISNSHFSNISKINFQVC